MKSFLTAFLLLIAIPANAAAAAPSCPDLHDDPLGGSGEEFGIARDYIVSAAPERNGNAGAIVVRDGNHTPRTVTLAQVPGAGAPAPGDRFGAALARAILDLDRPCNDTLAGAPGRNGTGEAFLLRGSTGARPREAVVIRAPDGAPGDEFGAAVAISPRESTRDHDLWIGAPGHDVAGQADAGAIYHWVMSVDGGLTYAGVVTQGARPRRARGGRPGRRGARAGDGRRGRGRAARGRRRPRRRGRGMRLSASKAPRYAAGSEAGARLGSAVDYRGAGIAAGAPGADVHGRKDAGLVADYSFALKLRRTYRQGVRGVPGRAEAGDRFGSALASGSSLRCQEDSALAIGVPGEDFRGLRDAGVVTLIQGGDITACHTRELSQGRGLSGRPRSRERTGATLGIAPDRPGLDEDTYDTLLVGAAGDVVLTNNAGFGGSRRQLRMPSGVFALPAPQY